MEPKQNDNDLADERAIVDQLRRLPMPDVPEGLEDRLIAAIPRPVSTKAQPPRRLVLAGISTMAAAALLLVVFSMLNSSVKNTSFGSGNGNREVVEAWPALALDPKETDPCNVLPPFGDWR